MPRFIVLVIRGYQLLISPLIGPRCRYSPSCSEYARQAVLKYGVIKGLWLGTKRVLRCHPWHEGGYDPLP